MIFSYHQFLTHSLNEITWGNKIAKVLAASINAVDPYLAVKNFAFCENGKLVVRSKTYYLDDIKNIYVVGAGKAGYPMASAISDLLGDYLSEGIVIVKENYGSKSNSSHKRIKFIEAGHPIPDQRGIEGTEKIISILQSTHKNDLVINLISGGGSALLTAPATGIELSQSQDMMRLLLNCGATISEINTLRKHLDRIKGGRLLRYASPARVLSLILSDVVGDPLDMIASGPTAPDTTSYRDAYSILEKYDLFDQIAPNIITILERGINGEIEETLKWGDPIFERTHNVIIGSNKIAAQAAIKQANLEGFNTQLLTTYLQGEARHSGEFLACIAKQLRNDDSPIELPACIVCGGETTVVVKGQGKGGRNTELALGAVEILRGLTNTILVSLATDGGDGSTDAAGAVVTGDTYDRGSFLDLYPGTYLNNNDSYNYYLALGDLLKPGPTYTNVNDLTFVFSI